VAKRPDSFYRDAVKDLRRGIIIDRDTGERTGKLASGFEARDGYNLRDVDTWTPAEKAKVTRLWNLVDELTAKPYQIVRKRKPENIHAVQKFAQHGTYPPELKVAIIKVAYPEEKAEVEVDPDTMVVTVTERGVSRRTHDFADYVDYDDLENFPRDTIKAMIAAVPESKMYGIQAGQYEVDRTYTERGVTTAVINLMNKYSEGKGHNPNDKNSSHWLNWLGGIVAYEYESVPKMEQYLLSDEHAHDAVSRYRKAEARRFEAKYGRPKKGRKKKTKRKR
jgi:hypothetical protein